MSPYGGSVTTALIDASRYGSMVAVPRWMMAGRAAMRVLILRSVETVFPASDDQDPGPSERPVSNQSYEWRIAACATKISPTLVLSPICRRAPRVDVLILRIIAAVAYPLSARTYCGDIPVLKH